MCGESHHRVSQVGRQLPSSGRGDGVRRSRTSPGAGYVCSRRGATVMARSGHGAFRLALTLSLAVASAASSAAGGDTAGSPLVVDPGTFAAMPAGRSSTKVSRGVGGHQGPRIALLSPGHDAVFRTGEPMALYAEFLPAADGAAPDMETLSVRVRKGLRGKDLTERVKPYVAGTAIYVPAVDFSGHAGEFRFELNIMDKQGRMSGAEFRVTFKLDFRDSLRLDDGT